MLQGKFVFMHHGRRHQDTQLRQHTSQHITRQADKWHEAARRQTKQQHDRKEPNARLGPNKNSRNGGTAALWTCLSGNRL